jgi:hypothetical protein
MVDLPPDDPSVRLNETEVARLMGRHVNTLRNRRALGKMPPSIRIGSETWFSAQDVRRWMTHGDVILPSLYSEHEARRTA